MTEIQTLFNGRFLKLCRRGSWEFVERTNPNGAVIIVALTEENRLLLVEQYRTAIDARTIEMPAGLIGDEIHQQRENALEAAQRELLEETGYTAKHIEYLISGPSSSGMSNEMITFVRASGLVRIHEGGGDATENITVHEVAYEEVDNWLKQKRAQGFSIDPKLYVGLYFLKK